MQKFTKNAAPAPAADAATDTTTAAADPNAALFAQLAEARRAAREEEQQQAARDAEAQDTEKRRSAIHAWNSHVANRIRDDLQSALTITVTVEHTDHDDTTSGYRAVGRFTSPITGNPCELYVARRYGDHYPVLHMLATDEYHQLPYRIMHEEPNPLDAPILDALDDEPRRLAEKQQAQAQAAQDADQPDRRAGAAATTPPFYTAILGHPDDTKNLLHVGSRIWLTVETPEIDEHSKHDTHCYELLDWSNTWLLVSNGRGSQWLIPVARVVTIQPASPSAKLN